MSLGINIHVLYYQTWTNSGFKNIATTISGKKVYIWWIVYIKYWNLKYFHNYSKAVVNDNLHPLEIAEFFRTGSSINNTLQFRHTTEELVKLLMYGDYARTQAASQNTSILAVVQTEVQKYQYKKKIVFEVVLFVSTPCPSINLNLCTYFNSRMAGPITMIFYEVKIWTLRFCIKYSSMGYMPICGANNGATFGHWKKVIFGVSRKIGLF